MKLSLPTKRGARRLFGLPSWAGAGNSGWRSALKKTLALAGIGALALMGLAAPAYADHQDENPVENEKSVTLCHRTGAEGNPYVKITVNYHSITGTNGHDGHNLVGNGPVGDIIPPFQIEEVSYAGKNWDSVGQAIYDAGCVVPVPTQTVTTPPPTTTPPTTPPATTPPPTQKVHKVTLCHRTGSATNPYLMITVDYHAFIQEGHDGHDQVGNGPVGDIIPPFSFDDGAISYEGKNWTAEGQAIFNNNCVIPTPTVTTTVPGPVTTVPGPVTTVPGAVVVKPGPGVVVKTAPPAAGAARGFNSQTAAGESEVMGNTALISGIALLAGAAGLALYRRQASRSH